MMNNTEDKAAKEAKELTPCLCGMLGPHHDQMDDCIGYLRHQLATKDELIERLQAMLTEEYKAARITAEQELSQELADEISSIRAQAEAHEAEIERLDKLRTHEQAELSLVLGASKRLQVEAALLRQQLTQAKADSQAVRLKALREVQETLSLVLGINCGCRKRGFDTIAALIEKENQ